MTVLRRWLAGVIGVGLATSALTVVAPLSAVAAPAPEVDTAAAPASPDAQPGFHPMAPTRVLDTRTGLGAAAAPIGPGESLDVRLAGVAGIPATGVAAVVVNITAVNPTSEGYLTVYPTGAARPTASALNFVAGQTVANEVIATVGEGGQVSVSNAAGTTHVLADVTGWFATGSYYTGLTPTRILDTRTGLGASAGPVGPGQTITVPVAGHGGVPATGVAAVALNLTATAPSATTYITEFPAGATRPTSSNLNLVPGQTVAVLVIGKLGANGAISLYNNAGNTHLVADVTGWFAPTGQFTPITPTRVADTRRFATALRPNEIRDVDVSSRVPETAGALVVSVTAVAPRSDGFLSVFPPDSPIPDTSALNFTTGQTVANVVIVPTTSRVVRVLNGSAGSTDLIVDLLGWFAGGPISIDEAGTHLPTDGNVAVPYHGVLGAVGGLPPYTWTVHSGALPDGLTLASTGPQTAAVTGTPTEPGRFPVTIRVADTIGVLTDLTATITVAAFVPGAVWSWGADSFGQLGNGVGGDNPTPNRVPTMFDVRSIASHGNGGYALRSDGTVWAWGNNTNGELGIGTVTSAATSPVQVLGLGDVTAIAGGGGVGYALKSDGTVWAWGDNSIGQLGDGTKIDRSLPAQVSGLTAVTAIAGGSGNGYALRSDGTVWAWGGNGDGELGDGSITSSVVPVQVHGLTGVTAIAAGPGTAYAVKSDGTAWAWGVNHTGQLGIGTTDGRVEPVQVHELTSVTAIEAGTRVGYAVTADGSAWAWGANENGQLGTGSTSVGSSIPVRVSGVSHVTRLDGDGETSYALTSDGAVWAWGSNSTGTVSEQNTGDVFTAPVRITALPPVTALVAGGRCVYVLGTP